MSAQRTLQQACTRRSTVGRRRLIAGVAAVAGLLLTGAVNAQQWPARPIRLIVPYAVGGVTDNLGRTVGQALGEGVGQAVIIDNRPGANGAIGSDIVARAAPDGYTLLLGAFSTHVLGPLLYKVPFDPAKDFEPLGTVAATPLMLVVNNDIPVKTVDQLIAWMKAHAGSVSFGSYGNGSTSHLAGELFKSMEHVDMVHVPYKGAAPAQTDLVGGQISLMFSDMSVLPLVKAGRVRALAVTGAQRSVSAPDIPTMAESGVAGYDVRGWFALYAPAKTPQAVVRAMQDQLAKMNADPVFKQKLAALGVDPFYIGAAALSDRMRDETARWRKIIDEANITVQ